MSILYPKLNIEKKKTFLDMVAISFSSPYKLIQTFIDEQNYQERIAIQNLVLDYFLYNEKAEVSQLRDYVFKSVRDIYHSASQYTTAKDVLEYLYQPANIKLLFEQSMLEMSRECGISKYDALDKSFKFRQYVHICESDKKELAEKQPKSQPPHYSFENSNNPVLPVLRHIVDSVYSEVILEPEHIATYA